VLTGYNTGMLRELTPVGRRIRARLLKSAHRMNIVLYPELARFRTDQDREEAMLAVQRSYSAGWRYAVTIIAFLTGGIVIGVAAAEGTLRLVRPVASWADSIVRGLMVMAGLVAALVVLGRLHRNRTRRELRRTLVRRGVAICLCCGYDLTRNVSGRCPECGEKADRRP
jgi:uncharacterized membrane protein YidH (DUF202 family)